MFKHVWNVAVYLVCLGDFYYSITTTTKNMGRYCGSSPSWPWMTMQPANTHHRGKCHCKADLPLDSFSFDQTGGQPYNDTSPKGECSLTEHLGRDEGQVQFLRYSIWHLWLIVCSDNGDLWRQRLEVGWVGRSPKSARARDAARARRLRDPGEASRLKLARLIVRTTYFYA